MKATLLTPEIAETVLAEKTKKHQKSQAYYDRTAKDLSELKPGDTVGVKVCWKDKSGRKELSHRTLDTVHTMFMWMVNCSEETVYILRKIGKSKLRNPPRNPQHRTRQTETYLSLLLKRMEKK